MADLASACGGEEQQSVEEIIDKDCERELDEDGDGKSFGVDCISSFMYVVVF